jgi:uncharacterized protein (DUF849 family)
MRRKVEVYAKQVEETRSQVTDTELKLSKYKQEAEEESAKQKLKLDASQRELEKLKALYEAAKTELQAAKNSSTRREKFVQMRSVTKPLC